MVELARELNRHAASATHEQTHLAEHPGQLVWIFMGMSVVGLMGETLQHLVAFGELKAVPASSGVRFRPSTGWRQFC